MREGKIILEHSTIARFSMLQSRVIQLGLMRLAHILDRIAHTCNARQNRMEQIEREDEGEREGKCDT